MPDKDIRSRSLTYQHFSSISARKFLRLTSGRQPHEWKHHLIKEAHFVYYIVTPAPKHFEKNKSKIENERVFHILENSKNEINSM